MGSDARMRNPNAQATTTSTHSRLRNKKSVVPDSRKSEESASRHLRGSPSGPSEYEEPMGSDARMRNPNVQATTTNTHSRLRNN